MLGFRKASASWACERSDGSKQESIAMSPPRGTCDCGRPGYRTWIDQRPGARLGSASPAVLVAASVALARGASSSQTAWIVHCFDCEWKLEPLACTFSQSKSCSGNHSHHTAPGLASLISAWLRSDQKRFLSAKNLAFSCQLRPYYSVLPGSPRWPQRPYLTTHAACLCASFACFVRCYRAHLCQTRQRRAIAFDYC